jgi:CheY-like chemotaxis protein
VKRSILLADDSPTIQRLVKQTFADANFDIVSVSNGDAAIRKFPELRPALVLADVYMPGRNGYEVCAFVKKSTGLAETPVVLLVGAFDAFDADTASQAGAAGHITKPFEPQALLDLVHSLLPAAEAPAEAAPEQLDAPGPAAEPEPVSMAAAAAVSASESGQPAKVQAPMPAPVVAAIPPEDDLLGLTELFPPDPEVGLTDAQMDGIVDRVVRKLSAQLIESVAWDVVPDIAEKILKEKLKKQA